MTPPPLDSPRSLRASLVHLGPGIVLASAIVGSGELIAATTVGAEATARRGGDRSTAAALHDRLDGLETTMQTLPAAGDETFWSIVIGISTALLLAVGRYAVIERVAIVIVGLFVAMTLVALGLALVIREPVAMVLASGLAQAVMLAALGIAVLWFRYGQVDRRLLPTRAADVLLWVSCLGFIAIGTWTIWHKLGPLVVGSP